MSSFDSQGRHFGELDTYNFIANWAIDVPFPFSKNDGWGRMGILGVLGDIVLTSLPNSHILEIGIGESSIYLSQLARKHNCKYFGCDLAIGKISNPMTIPDYLLDHRILINNDFLGDYENHQGILFHGTSDDFFKDIKFPQIGLAFIDGDHHYEQVDKDFWNVYNLLCDDGVCFLHDTMPPSEDYVLNDYCSDAYKMRQKLETNKNVDCFTFPKLVAMGVGLTMVRKKPQHLPYYQESL